MNSLFRRFTPLAASTIAALLLSACGSGGDSSADPTLTTEKSASRSAVATVGKPAVLPVSQGVASAAVPDRYIVVFNQEVGDAAANARQLMNGAGGQLHHVYAHALRGFAATIPSQALAAISRNPSVAYVEPDLTVSAAATTQASPPSWGLDRVDQRSLPLDSSYSYGSDGAGVTAFVIDTGIRATHTEFYSADSGVSRVDSASGRDFVDNDGNPDDCAGHGTHVAGTIGGLTVGIARAVRLVPVRVLDCLGNGYVSDVIAGIDFVVASGLRPAVANLSLSAGASSSLDAAVNNAVAQGVSMVVAAGNNGSDACNFSPARAGAAITVGATDATDTRASFSNYGRCLDLFAPGVNIRSAYHSYDSAMADAGGTSMASPHVAGVIARILSVNQAMTPSELTARLLADATGGVVQNAGRRSPKSLLFATLDDAGGPPPPPPPEPPPAEAGTADITLQGGVQVSKRNWKATVQLSVSDASVGALAGASVSGNFSVGGSGSCTTGSDGSCTLSSSAISNKTASTSFTVTSVTNASGAAYQQLQGQLQLTISR